MNSINFSENFLIGSLAWVAAKCVELNTPESVRKSSIKDGSTVGACKLEELTSTLLLIYFGIAIAVSLMNLKLNQNAVILKFPGGSKF